MIAYYESDILFYLISRLRTAVKLTHCVVFTKHQNTLAQFRYELVTRLSSSVFTENTASKLNATASRCIAAYSRVIEARVWCRWREG